MSKSRRKKRVMLLEDDTVLSELLTSFLQMNQYNVEAFVNGNDAYSMLSKRKYDIALLDVCVPGVNGLEVLSMVRTKDNKVPIIIVTGNTSDEEELKAFQQGTNLFHKKPIQTRLLLYQIRSLLETGKEDVIEYKDLKLDENLKVIWLHGRELKLSPNEYATMKLLIKKQNKVVSKDEIIENLYIYDDEILPSSVDTMIFRLRSKLEAEGADEDLIKTARGFGYRLG